MKQYIDKILDVHFNGVPYCYRHEFFEENLKINILREKIYLLILLVWNGLIALFNCLGALNGDWNIIPVYKYEFYIHILGFVFAALFLWQFLIKRKKNIVSNELLSFAFVFFALIWLVALSIMGIILHKPLVLYSFAAVIISFRINMSTKESLYVFLTTYIIFVAGLMLASENYIIIEKSVLNGLIITVCGIIISHANYAFNVDNFLKRKTIQEKTVELENTKKMLEQALLIRNEQLDCVNEKLVQEIKSRHAIEIQMLKADLEFQKSNAALNKAMEYDRLRGEFFANITHELRTPLNIMFSAIQLIDYNLDNNSVDINKLKKHIKFIRQNGYRLLRLIKNIIDMTKIESHYLDINLKNCDIVEMIKNITYSIAPYAHCNECTVEFFSELKQKTIAFDWEQVERIMLNLLSNAIKFSSPKGRISVSIFEKNNYVVIKVKDNGIGIPKEMQQNIFDRFIQANKSAAREKEGSGIGLSLVKSFVEMHDGRINVESTTGKGSEFIIELPDKTVDMQNYSTDYKVVCNTEAINMEFCDIYSEIS